MRSACGEHSDNLRTSSGKVWGGLSTTSHLSARTVLNLCVQSHIFTLVVRVFHPELFTLKWAILPPVEQKFYPLSTEPIISITN